MHYGILIKITFSASGDQSMRTIKQFPLRKSQKLIPYPEMYTMQRNNKNALKNCTSSIISLSKR